MLKCFSRALKTVGLGSGIAGLFLCTAVQAAPNILFVGNSYTYGHVAPMSTFNSAGVTDLNGTNYGGVPGIFKKMADLGGYSCTVSQETVGSYYLHDHYNNKLSLITAKAYDTVILQGQSGEPLPTTHGGTPSDFDNYASLLKNAVVAKNSAVQTYLYSPWSDPSGRDSDGYSTGVAGLKQMQTDLDASYNNAASAYGFTGVVPVGDAFIQTLNDGVGHDPTSSTTPGYNMWYSDNHHASAYGYFLSAAVFYAKLTGNDPRALPYDTSFGTNLGITASDAATLEAEAYKIVPEPGTLGLLLVGSTLALRRRARGM